MSVYSVWLYSSGYGPPGGARVPLHKTQTGSFVYTVCAVKSLQRCENERISNFWWTSEAYKDKLVCSFL